jgi:hypothetical protein
LFWRAAKSAIERFISPKAQPWARLARFDEDLFGDRGAMQTTSRNPPGVAGTTGAQILQAFNRGFGAPRLIDRGASAR